MARQVKCKFCGEQNDINKSYKTVIYNSKGTPSNAYFCNEKCYAEAITQKEAAKAKKAEEKLQREKKKYAEEAAKQKRKEDKNKVYRLVCDIIGRKEIINSILWEERSIWNKVASDEIIGQYLQENKNYLTNMISRLDNKEFNRIRYLSAVIKNNIGDYKPKVKEETIIPVTLEEHYETKFKVKTRKGFEDLEDDFDE